MAAPFTFDRRFWFDVEREVLWSTIRRTERFPSWWGWLREFDSDGLREGAAARCVIRAPLPYTLRFTVHVEQVVESELVATRIEGDLDGPARLELEDAARGCRARLLWSLRLRDPVLRRLAVVARPAMTWAHDRVVDVGVRDFQARALDGTRDQPS